MDGYFYGEGGFKWHLEKRDWVQIKTECRIIDEAINEVKVEYKHIDDYGNKNTIYYPPETKWIPREDFIRYRTAKELDEVVRKLEEGGK
jgi:hypothetical protein